MTICRQYLSQCDEVLMMKDGRLVERGSHAELMERRGEYFRLVSYDTTSAGHGQRGHPGDDRPAPGTAALNGN